MSKIERALRKAEEDRQKKIPSPSPQNEAVATEVPQTIQVETKKAHSTLPDLSESFRKISARLKSCCENVNATDVLFTSSISQEGKTTAVVNCAISLSQDFDLSVCLVDCDMRHPSLPRFFNLTGGPLLVDALKGRAEVASIIRPTSLPNLSVVHTQRVGRSSLSLVSSERMGKIMSDLRSRFDLVLFDSPPILPVADAAVLSKKVSAIVLVIEPGRTRRKHLEQIVEQVDPTKIVGFIMNYKNYRIPPSYNYTKYYDYGKEPGAVTAPAGNGKKE